MKNLNVFNHNYVKDTVAPIFTRPNQCIEWLKNGGILAYPTESVWGIGCDAMNEQAVLEILAIKNRPIDKGMIVVTDSVERIKPLLDNLTEEQRQRVIASWQQAEIGSQQNQHSKQATTWLLPIPATINIPNWITGKHNSVAVRVIAHPYIKQLCAQMVSAANPFGFIISTSCNPATYPPATTLAEAKVYFDINASQQPSSSKQQKQIAYLLGDTLGYTLPSQIKDAIRGTVIR